MSPNCSSFFSAGLRFLEVVVDTFWDNTEGELSLWQDPKLREPMHHQEEKNNIFLNYLTLGLKKSMSESKVIGNQFFYVFWDSVNVFFTLFWESVKAIPFV